MSSIYIYLYNADTNTIGEKAFEEIRNDVNDNVKRIVLTKSPLILNPELKDPDIQEYPEEHGKRISINNKFKSYTYTFTLTCILGKEYDLNLVNNLILDIQTKIQGKCIAIYNKYRRQKIVGYVWKTFKINNVERIEISSNYRDIVDFEIECEINNPILCNLSETDYPE